MKHMASIALVILISTAFASAGDLATYKATYTKQLQRITFEHGRQTRELGDQYLRSLDRLLAKAKAAGDLNETTAVMDELARFPEEKAMPVDSSSMPAMRDIQAAYIKQKTKHTHSKARQITKLTSQYDSALAQLQKSLVSSGKLDDAKAIQEERQRCLEAPFYANAKGMLDQYAQASNAKRAAHRAQDVPPQVVAPTRRSQSSIRLPTRLEARKMVRVTSSEYPEPTPVADLEKETAYFRRWRSESYVVMVHPFGHDRPSLIDFSEITTKHKGRLVVKLHPTPGHDCAAGLIVEGETQEEVTLRGDKWITLEAPFDHQEVLLEGRTGGRHKWNNEHLYATYRFKK